jgi:hypothetical protein
MNFKIALICLFLSGITYAQSILDEFSASQYGAANYQLVTEKIVNISISKRILLLTNDNDSYARGDFISLLIEKKPVARALVAKINGSLSAVKITKIYSLTIFNTFRKGLEVQVIRGDDSYYRLTKPKEDIPNDLIQDEEDLYDETTIQEGDYEGSEDNKNSAIKNDNVVYAGLGIVNGKDQNGDDASTQQLQISWMYQLQSNIWFEALVGQHLLKNYPGDQIDTEIRNYSFKLKYAIKGPLYTIFLPYVGFQIIDANSPGAGVNAATDEIANKELAMVEEVKDRGPIFGVTMLRRLVPGWFIKVELGTDNMSGGLALEF